MTAHTARRAGSLSMVAQRPAQAHRLRTDKMDICKQRHMWSIWNLIQCSWQGSWRPHKHVVLISICMVRRSRCCGAAQRGMRTGRLAGSTPRTLAAPAAPLR